MYVVAYRKDASRSVAGFTLIEFLAVLTIILIISLIGYPAMKNLVDKGRVVGAVRGASTVLVQARQEAVRTNNQVVARADFTNNELLVFANVDRDADLLFEPTADSDKRRADYIVGTSRLPADYDIYFWGPADNDPNGSDAVDGLTATKTGPAAVFLPDGSIQDPGAFRIADDRGNFFEIRMESQATAKPDVLKWHPDPPWGGKAAFFPEGRHTASNIPLWEWY